MKILGIDPGLATTGYAVVDYGDDDAQNDGQILDFGVISTKAERVEAARLEEIYNGVSELIKIHGPGVASVESLFFCNNAKTAMKVGQARGVVILACQQAGLDFFEYTPRQVKQAVVGYGVAEKNQVQYMVQNIFSLPELPKPDDAADALALCYCHSIYSNICS